MKVTVHGHGAFRLVRSRAPGRCWACGAPLRPGSGWVLSSESEWVLSPDGRISASPQLCIKHLGRAPDLAHIIAPLSR